MLEKIKPEEQLFIKNCVNEHLILLKIWNILDINKGLLQWFIIFFDKNPSGGTVTNENILKKRLIWQITQINYNKILRADFADM